MSRPAADPALSAGQLHWAALCAGATLLPHLPRLPLWLGALAALILLWRVASTRFKGAVPVPRLLAPLLALGAGVLILTQYGTLFGQQAGIALLVLMLGLKYLECRRPRDIQVLVLLCFFLQLGLFLDTQSPLTGAGALLGAWLATTTLLSLHSRQRPSAQVRTAGLLMLQALPLMVVMFVLFPRIPGPLWGLPADAFSGRTGLSDHMEPGAISSLSQSGEIAFRADFAGAPPPPAQRYWRGPVLVDFDGRRWTAPPPRTASQPAYTPRGTAYDYVLTLEAHNRRWLLALDYPGAGIADALYTDTLTVLARQPVHQRMRYAATAYPDSPVGTDLAAGQLIPALALPASGNPRTRALGETLRQRHGQPEAVVTAAIDWLRQAGLMYTLRPPRLGLDTADAFLFDTRQGFCEHFASAFVVLMRAAGVPARVVTGYQGGEINPFDNTLVVRQSDAHAWAEVWLAGEGWRRIDPTAAAAPLRIDGGLAAALPDDAALPLLLRPDLGWLKTLRDRWEFLGNAWNQWVLGYDQKTQRSFLQRLGLTPDDWRQLGMVLLIAIGTVLAALAWWAQRRTLPADPLQRAWQRFERKLARAGLPRLPWEGPADYATRAALAFPASAAAIRAIAGRYATLRYGAAPASARDAQALHSQIKRFSIQCG
ncbi:transglutaminase TgpA family protein [Denitromonas iodatirespirans]|uniref:DUF3488 domain-containing transglutaminase family protein n=1 Tax=Denitromonas iodatirespirans TaxID=2795389 RepID=A0A944H8L2_DENI1|nr:DUF3488 and transglutaminase-like domain-containing protein [Denitromonas iodatirespirans]MBT0961495.1 DUF3488 domain-containing transglutaminase family protein [Denitromonas iodatirespirans]